MKRCNATLKIEDDDFSEIKLICQLEKDHNGKHKSEGIHEGKLFRVEWWDELPVIEGLTEIYVSEKETN